MALRDLFRRNVGARPAAARPMSDWSVAELRATVERRPDQVAARLLLADRLAGQGARERALTEYHAVVDAYVEHDQHGKAVRLLRRLTAAEPERADLAERLAALSALETTVPRRDLHIARLARRPAGTLRPTDLDAASLRGFWGGIGASPLVRDLDDDALGLLLAAAEVVHLSPMSILVRAGQWHLRCYVMVEGDVDATRTGPNGVPISLVRFGPGDVFGDGALLDETPWAADHRTSRDRTTVVLRLSRRRLEENAEAPARVEALLGALRRHGRDHDVAAAAGRFRA